MKLDEREIGKRLEHLEELCKQQGLPVTPQRIAIYRALLRTDAHPDAEALYDSVRREFPNLSLATVYKNLDVFEKLGVVRELTPLHETARFDANLEHHHHLICTGCQQVVDVHDADLDAIRLAPAQVAGFQVAKIHVQIEGLCPRCATRANAGADARS